MTATARADIGTRFHARPKSVGLGEFFRRITRKLGRPQAITATAHKLARIIFHLLTTKEGGASVGVVGIRDVDRMLRAPAAYKGYGRLNTTERFVALTPERFQK